jgi:hypothetical protein
MKTQTQSPIQHAASIHAESPARRHRARLVAGLALAGSALLAPQGASAATQYVSGSYTWSAVAPPCAGLSCYEGQYSGDVAGSATSALVVTTPTTEPGLVFYIANNVIDTANGQLRCTVYAANDLGSDFGGLAPTDGEAGGLCKITGGTGAYAGATGSLMIYGFSEGSVGLIVLPGNPPRTGKFNYVGKIVTP